MLGAMTDMVRHRGPDDRATLCLSLRGGVGHFAELFSERAAADELRKEKAKEKAKLLEELSEGDVRTGKVTSLADFGAFVNIEGADGLVHLSEISWERIDHPVFQQVMARPTDSSIIGEKPSPSPTESPSPTGSSGPTAPTSAARRV